MRGSRTGDDEVPLEEVKHGYFDSQSESHPPKHRPFIVKQSNDVPVKVVAIVITVHNTASRNLSQIMDHSESTMRNHFPLQ